MSSSIIMILCFVAIAVCVALNFVWGIHMGLTAMSAAFFIGCLLNGDKVTKVFGYWPDNLIFFMLAAALFYGYARENGTIVAFGKNLLYLFRKNILLIPFACFIVATIMSFLGAGMATIFFLVPVAFEIGDVIHMDPILMCSAVNLGYTCGTYNPWTGNGVQLVGLIAENGVDSVEALRMGTAVYGTMFIRNTLFMVIFFIVFALIPRFRQKKTNADVVSIDVIEKPEPFSKVQKKTFVVIIVSFLLILIPGIISTMFDIEAKWFNNLAQFCQPQSMMIVCALVCSLLNLADTKKVISKLPMNSITMIAGVCFLMSIASSAGLDDVVVNFFETNNFSPILVVTIVTAVCGFLSLFSSTWSVVLPMMYPLVPAMAMASGVSDLSLYVAVIAGSSATTLCPFSTAGAQMMSMAPLHHQDSMMGKLLLIAGFTYLMSVVLALVGFYGIFV